MNHAPVHLGPRELREVYAEPFAAAIRDAGPAVGHELVRVGRRHPVRGRRVDPHRPAARRARLRRRRRRRLLRRDAARHPPPRRREQRRRGGARARPPASTSSCRRTDCYGEPLQAARARRRRAHGGRRSRRPPRAHGQGPARSLREPIRRRRAPRPRSSTLRNSAPLARRAAAGSIVLLTNDGVLPLADELGSIAVIGPAADDIRLLQGDYHYPAHAEITYESATSALLPTSDAGSLRAGPYFTAHVTPLAALRAVYGDRVAHERGCAVTGDDTSGIDAAVAVAATSRCRHRVRGRRVGVAAALHGRRGARRDIARPHRRAAPARRCGDRDGHADGRGARERSGSRGRRHRDERGGAGAGVARRARRAATGSSTCSPDASTASGRLPVSMPRTVGQVPVYALAASGRRSEPVLRRLHRLPVVAAVPVRPRPFLRDVRALVPRRSTPPARQPSRSPSRSSTENTSDRAGVDVVQLAVRDDVASVARHRFFLCGFARVPLEPGERRTVRFTVDPSRLAFYDPQHALRRRTGHVHLPRRRRGDDGDARRRCRRAPPAQHRRDRRRGSLTSRMTDAESPPTVERVRADTTAATRSGSASRRRARRPRRAPCRAHCRFSHPNTWVSRHRRWTRRFCVGLATVSVAESTQRRAHDGIFPVVQ